MREWCGCGAAIRAWRRSDVLTWRAEHTCPAKPEEVQVPPTGGGSQVELSYADIDMGDRARIGFSPN